MFGMVALLGVGLPFEYAAAQLPDLTVDFKGPPTAYPGEDITAKVQISLKNIGGTEARSFYVDIILREPTGKGHTCIRERVESVTPRKPVRSFLGKNKSILVPNDLPPGQYQLCAVVDPTDDVRESREKNNTLCHPFTLKGKDAEIPRVVNPLPNR